MNNYRLKIYTYVHGVLQIVYHEFAELDQAIAHGLGVECQKFKVHDKDGNVCHDSEGHHHHEHYC